MKTSYDEKRISDVIAHLNGTTKDTFIVNRRHHLSDLKNARLIAIYAAPGQGLSEFIQTNIVDKHGINCNENLKRRNIYKLLLNMWGYEVSVESRKKKRISALASIKLFGQSANAGGELEGETDAHFINIDLTDPAEVCHLLNKNKSKSPIVLFNFDRLTIQTQRNLLFDLGYFKDTSDLQFIITLSYHDKYYLERIDDRASSSFYKLYLDYWNSAEVEEYIEKIFKYLEVPISDFAKKVIIEFGAGDIININYCIEKILAHEKRVDEISETELTEYIQNNISEYYTEIYTGRIRKFINDRKFYVEYQSVEDKTSENVKILTGKLLDAGGASLNSTKMTNRKIGYNEVNLSFNRMLFEFLFLKKQSDLPPLSTISEFASHIYEERMVNPDRELPTHKVISILDKLVRRQKKYRLPHEIIFLDKKKQTVGFTDGFTSMIDLIDKEEVMELMSEPDSDLDGFSVPEGWRELWRDVKQFEEEEIIKKLNEEI